jgi:hypothetical protein
MKIKSFLLTTIILLFFSVTTSVSAQGLFKQNSPAPEATEGGSSDTGGSLRGTAPGTGGGVAGPGTPIGEGLLILSALAGSYALIQKKNNKKGGYEA